MKSREIFRLAIKIIGFIIVLQGFRNCIESLMILKGYAIVRLSTPQYWAAWAIIKIGFGAYLMVRGVPFLNLAFPLKAAAGQDGNEPTALIGSAGSKGANAGLLDPKVMFGLAVKIVGLILVLYGLEYFLDALLHAMNPAQSNETAAAPGAVFAVAEIVLGLAMLRGLVPLVEFAFPQAASEGATTVHDAREQDQKERISHEEGKVLD